MDFQTFLKEKYEPLVAKVTSMEKTLKIERDERERLLNRICELEDTMEHLSDIIKKLQTKEQEDEKRIKVNRTPSNTTEEPWLFYCKTGRSLAQIAKSLNRQVHKGIELFCPSWRHEADMWTDLLKKLEITCRYESDPKNLEVLRKLGFNGIEDAYQSNTVIIVRGLSSEQKQFEVSLTHISVLCEVISNFWVQMEENEDENLTGLICSRRIGYDYRA